MAILSAGDADLVTEGGAAGGGHGVWGVQSETVYESDGPLVAAASVVR